MHFLTFLLLVLLLKAIAGAEAARIRASNQAIQASVARMEALLEILETQIRARLEIAPN